MEDRDREPRFEGGAQPVPEHPPEAPGAGRTVGQIIALIVGGLVLLAGAMWLLVPLLSG